MHFRGRQRALAPVLQRALRLLHGYTAAATPPPTRAPPRIRPPSGLSSLRRWWRPALTRELTSFGSPVWRRRRRWWWAGERSAPAGPDGRGPRFLREGAGPSWVPLSATTTTTSHHHCAYACIAFPLPCWLHMSFIEGRVRVAAAAAVQGHLRRGRLQRGPGTRAYTRPHALLLRIPRRGTQV